MKSASTTIARTGLAVLIAFGLFIVICWAIAYPLTTAATIAGLAISLWLLHKLLSMPIESPVIQGLGLALRWIVAALGITFAAWCLVMLSPTERYGWYYSVPSVNVTIQNRPHNCDFRWAPEGEKGCHYEKSVTTFVDSNQQRQVVVSWNKVDDE